MIHERFVLRWIEHLEHRRRRITGCTTGTHLVDLVDHHHRIAHTGAPQRLDHEARHCGNVGSTVTAHFRLVTHAAHRDAVELAADGGGDRFAQRGLARTRWADEAENRASRIATTQLAHGEILDDSFLCLAKPVMSRVERGIDLVERDVAIA